MKILQKMIKNQSLLLTIAVGIIFCVISLALYNYNYDLATQKINLSDEEIFADCIVESFPERNDKKTSFCARVKNASAKYLIGEGVFVSIKDFDGEIQKGDRVKVKAEFFTANTATNDGAFDYKNYLKSLDVVGICYPDKEKLEITKKESLLRNIYDVRLSFITNCQKHIYKSGPGLVSAVLTGDRSGIDEKTQNNLKTAGIYHIVAISGLHLNLFIMLVSNVIAKSKMKRKKKAFWSLVSCTLIGLFIMVFTGFGISVIRAYIMMLIMFSASLLPREANSKNSLFVTGFIVISLMPYTIYSVSWWLSFLSTLGVIDGVKFAKKLKESKMVSPHLCGYVGQTFIVSAFTSVYTLPVTSYSFGYLQMYSCIANVFVLHAMSIFMILGIVFAFSSAFAVPFITKWLAFALTAMGEYLSLVAKVVTSLPYSTIDTYHSTFPRLLCFGICSYGIIKMATQRKFAKMIAFSLAFAVAVSTFLMYNGDKGKMEITFADAGQGDCTFLEINGYDIMIDCGSQDSSGYAVSSLESMLRAKNVKKLDVLFITHYHKDHTSGAITLLEKDKAKLLVLPLYYDFEEGEAKKNKENLICAATKNNIPIKYVAKGTKIPFGNDANIEILSPSDEMFFENNDMSLISKITYGETDVLFLGDAEEKALKHLDEKDAECDILKLAHHGSYCDMTEKTLRNAKPQIAVASCGKNNLYGHPKQKTLDVLKEIDCDVYRTDQHGAITIKADKKENFTITAKR